MKIGVTGQDLVVLWKEWGIPFSSRIDQKVLAQREQAIDIVRRKYHPKNIVAFGHLRIRAHGNSPNCGKPNDRYATGPPLMVACGYNALSVWKVHGRQGGQKGLIRADRKEGLPVYTQGCYPVA